MGDFDVAAYVIRTSVEVLGRMKLCRREGSVRCDGCSAFRAPGAWQAVVRPAELSRDAVYWRHLSFRWLGTAAAHSVSV